MRTALLRATLVSFMLAAEPAHGDAEDDIRAAFATFVDAQNAHDLKLVDRLLAESSQFLWIEPAHVVRTRDDALQRFGELFQRGWRIEPHWTTYHVVMLDVSTAEVMLFVSVTAGAPTRLMRLSQMMVNTASGWRVSAIVTDRPQPDPPQLPSPPPRKNDPPNVG